MALPSIFSSSATSRSAETESEADDSQDVESIVLCFFTHQACSPLLQFDLQGEELCKVALKCHFALDVVFLCGE